MHSSTREGGTSALKSGAAFASLDLPSALAGVARTAGEGIPEPVCEGGGGGVAAGAGGCGAGGLRFCLTFALGLGHVQVYFVRVGKVARMDLLQIEHRDAEDDVNMKHIATSSVVSVLHIFNLHNSMS